MNLLTAPTIPHWDQKGGVPVYRFWPLSCRCSWLTKLYHPPAQLCCFLASLLLTHIRTQFSRRVTLSLRVGVSPLAACLQDLVLVNWILLDRLGHSCLLPGSTKSAASTVESASQRTPREGDLTSEHTKALQICSVTSYHGNCSPRGSS